MSYTSMVVQVGTAPTSAGLQLAADLSQLLDHGADDGPRTRYPLFGRQVLIHMSFVCVER